MIKRQIKLSAFFCDDLKIIEYTDIMLNIIKRNMVKNMAAIDDLINQISDKVLRDRIRKETNRLQHNKKFGLVFEEHLPECTPLYDVKVKVGSKVAVKGKTIDNIFVVKQINNQIAICNQLGTTKIKNIPLKNLVSIAEFGDPIYPYLKKIDSISTAPQSDLWHELIEADNYHALQLLEYTYAGKVDCIYIDPPYNTGAKDWKYNNDYVDSSDSYRHSKWLSFMEKRLKLAKRLLNLKNSTLIVTIDEKEYIHLGSLLEELFPNARMQMITSVINPKGVARIGKFSRVDEYIYVLMFGKAKPIQTTDPMLTLENTTKDKKVNGTIWLPLKRSGSSSLRVDRPNLFYPIYIDMNTGKVVEVGTSIPADISADEVKKKDGCITVLPIKRNGTEGRWQLQRSTVIQELKEGTVRVKEKKDGQYIMQHLNAGAKKEINNGSLNVIGKDKNGALIVERLENKLVTAKTVWNKASHDATTYGTNLLKNILIDRDFPYPKSLYAVKDILNLFVKNNKNALILDFFAGSGTTLHAINLLNKEDNGHRKCIIVTNNEVSDKESEKLENVGIKPGDKKWEKKGIAQYVTWPRTICSITGKDIKGKPLKGNYLDDSIPMSDGFKTNVAYFKLGFLDKNSIALGRQFTELLPILWMKAGSIGKCPEIKDKKLNSSYYFIENHFAVLLDEKVYTSFEKKVNDDQNIETVYIITNSDNGYHEMISNLNVKNTYQLYKDYLDNFRINIKG